MRSKISTFESTPMPIVRMNPAMPGSVIAAPRYAISPEQDDQVEDHRDDGVDARQLVVGEHEDDDEHEAGERRQDARADRVGAERRTDRRAPRGKSSTRAARRSAAPARGRRLLLREAAGDAAVVGDRPSMRGAECTRSSRMIASERPMFSPVTLPNLRAPSGFSVNRTAGRLFSSIVGVGAAQILPVTAATLRTR